MACAESRPPARQPSADVIMARVAQLQDQAQSERARYVYVQHATVTSRRGHTLHCQEVTDIRMTPSGAGSSEQLLHLDGRLLLKGLYVDYHTLQAEKGHPEDDDSVSIELGSDDSDRDMVENMRKNLLGTQSKDGINANLFPLTSKQQADYTFTLLGREPRNGRDTFHIRFKPRDNSDIDWKGDAWIDTTAFQPVVIRTALSRNLPLGVRVLLGTNVPGIGFTVIYAPQPANQPGQESEPVWFPISFGSEFKIHVLFFFSREMVISAENRDFERTHVTSTILDAASPTLAPKQP